jgi:hypothetical protein
MQAVMSYLNEKKGNDTTICPGTDTVLMTKQIIRNQWIVAF